MKFEVHTRIVVRISDDALFSALESGRPDSLKIRSALFWAFVFQIRAILKIQGDPQKQLKIN